jgi:hypothetical protein
MVCAYTNTPSTNTVNSNGILVARVQSSANDTVSQNTLIIPPGTLYACFALNVPYIVIPLHPRPEIWMTASGFSLGHQWSELLSS